MVRSLVPVRVRVPGIRDEGLLTDETMYDPVAHRPCWSTAETSRLFFGRRAEWLSLHHAAGKLYRPDGSPLQVGVAPGRNEWEWRVCDIEQAAHALAQQGLIPLDQLVRTLGIVKLVAQNHGYLPSDLTVEMADDEPDAAVEARNTRYDDMTGEPGAEARTFAISGTEYHVDLTPQHWAAFLDAVAPYVKAATLAPRRAARALTDVRQWAREHGYDIGTRGPIPMEVMTAWHRSMTS